jgi:hypothetical protein
LGKVGKDEGESDKGHPTIDEPHDSLTHKFSSLSRKFVAGDLSPSKGDKSPATNKFVFVMGRPDPHATNIMNNKNYTQRGHKVAFHLVASCKWHVASCSGINHLQPATCHLQPEGKMSDYALCQYITTTAVCTKTDQVPGGGRRVKNSCNMGPDLALLGLRRAKGWSAVFGKPSPRNPSNRRLHGWIRTTTYENRTPVHNILSASSASIRVLFTKETTWAVAHHDGCKL